MTNTPITSNTNDCEKALKGNSNPQVPIRLDLPRRCGTYWWYYGRMTKAACMASDERASDKDRRGFQERVDEEARMIGYHMAECNQCREWLRSMR